jgi:hypothetical protein
MRTKWIVAMLMLSLLLSINSKEQEPPLKVFPAPLLTLQLNRTSVFDSELPPPVVVPVVPIPAVAPAMGHAPELD